MVGPLTEICSSLRTDRYGLLVRRFHWLWLCNRDSGQYHTSGSQTVCNATHKLKLILTDQLTSFALGYMDVIILILYLRYILNLDFQGQMGKMLVISFFGSLIGVSMGMFIGSFGKMQEGAKIGIILGISMVSSFLAGLMNGNMKDIVEKSVPIVNRINPASLISDAFYCINVYDDMIRYYRNLITLAVMCVVLALASFFMVRRERYDSI